MFIDLDGYPLNDLDINWYCKDDDADDDSNAATMAAFQLKMALLMTTMADAGDLSTAMAAVTPDDQIRKRKHADSTGDITPEPAALPTKKAWDYFNLALCACKPE